MSRPVIALALGAMLLLPGCVGVVAYGQTRESARPLIEKIMAEARPDLNGKAAAGCVLKAMTIPETVKLGVSDTTVVTTAATAQVLDYARRAEAAECLVALPVAGDA